MHKDDPYTLSMALSESNRRKEMRAGSQAQGGQQPKVVDQVIQGMGPPQAPQQPMPQPMPQQPQPAQAGRQLPEEQGIGALPAPNMQGMADGGIVGYASRGAVKAEDPLAQYEPMIRAEAERQGIDPEVALLLFRQESAGDKKAIGPKTRKTGEQAVGLGQLMEAAAKEMGIKPEERKDPAKNIQASIGYFKKQLNRFGTYEKAAAAYNWGPGNMETHIADSVEKNRDFRVGLPKETAGYLTKVVPPAVAGPANIAYQEQRSKGASTTPAKPTAPTGIQTLVEEGPVDPMGNVPYTEQGAPRAQSGTKSPVASVLAATADVVPNALTGFAGEISRVINRPFMSSKEADAARSEAARYINPIGKLLGVEQDPAYRQAPTQQVLDQMSKYLGMSAEQISKTSGMSLSDAESVQNMLLAFGPKAAGKIANIKPQSNMPVRPGTPTKSGAAPLMSEGELALRQAQAEAAQNAARRNASPVQGELFDKIQAPIPAGAPKTPLGAAMETAVKDNRRSEQMSLFPPEELPVPPAIDRVLKPRNEALEAARSANERRALAAEDVRPVQQRMAENRQKILDAEAIKARERAVAAETQVGRQGERPPAGPSLRERFVAEADKGKYVIPGALVAGEAAKNAPLPYAPNVEGFDRNRGAGETYEENFVGTGTPVTKTEVPIEERSRIEPKETKKGSGFSDEDMLMLGLNLMAGKSQYALSNLGEAGIATLGAKREREKLAADKEQRDIMGEYYKRLSGTLGTSAEERMIAQVMKEEGIPYAAAIERISGAKFAPRAETTERDFMKQYESLAKTPGFIIDNPDAAAWVQNQMRMRGLTSSGSANLASGARFVGFEGQQ
jgi:hypothetical protein